MTIVFNGHLNQTGAETGETGALARSDIQLDGAYVSYEHVYVDKDLVADEVCCCIFRNPTCSR